MSFNKYYSKLIYCDLDGVLCDFDAQWNYYTRTGMTPLDFKNIYGEEEFFEELAKYGTEFWTSMPWKTDGVLLWNYIEKYRPIILTRPSGTEECIEGKEWWVKANLPPKTDIIFSDPKTNNKEAWATSDSLLIDDDGTTVRKFIIKGGDGIIHTNSIQTINDLNNKFGL